MPMTPEAKRELSSTIRSSARAPARRPARRRPSRPTGSPCTSATPGSPRRLGPGGSGSRTGSSEQERAEAGRGQGRSGRKDDIRRDAEKQAAYTLLNRLVFLRLLEAPGSRKPLRSVTGGWESQGYKDFRQLAPALVRGDETEGYAFLLRLVFEELATDLPGLYGHAGVADLVPGPGGDAAARRRSARRPGARVAAGPTTRRSAGSTSTGTTPSARRSTPSSTRGGKLEPHEIASKTQMFTERYMVEWLLQNSLGPMWLAMCKKHGWTPEVEADGTLARLEERRAEWRAKREAGEVALDRADAAPDRRRATLDVLRAAADPRRRGRAGAREHPRPEGSSTRRAARGTSWSSRFDLLLALYREEARHRGEDGQERWSDRAIVERILENNLHGIDLDPRAVQIAAAALWLKAKQTCPEAQPERLNLVASNLRLASLADDDPALVELRREVERETGIPAQLTDTIVHALQGADHLGSLLKIDTAVDEAIRTARGGVRACGRACSRATLWRDASRPSSD